MEAKVLADVNGTSGIQTQAYATSVLATLRKGRDQARGGRIYKRRRTFCTRQIGKVWSSHCPARTPLSTFRCPTIRRPGRLFGVPVTTSNGQAAGVGHVIATDAVALDTDTRGVDVQWSENATADSFGKNLVFARCESRYATSMFSPLGVVSLDLTP